MPEDEKQEEVQEEETEETETEEETDVEETEDEQDTGKDYRGKLNATNNFLKKEGYTFNQVTKLWEKPAVAPKPKAPKAPALELSPKDALLLAKADIDIEDVDEVVDFAKYRKIPISEALTNTTLKAILADRVEERKTATATNSRGTPGAKKATGQSLVEQASKGTLPDKDEDIARLVAAEEANKRKK